MSDVEAELATSASLTSVIATQKSRTAAMNPMIAAAANFLSRTISGLLSLHRFNLFLGRHPLRLICRTDLAAFSASGAPPFA
jgi:hypothetical protein